MSGRSIFRVTISNFKARGLPKKDRNGAADPYLKCNFDSFKTFKTDVVEANLNPDFTLPPVHFKYETRYVNQLHKKSFEVECYDKDTFGSDEFMGSCAVDLHTLATGPVEHDLLLRDGGKPCGRITFDVVMEQMGDIEITMKDVSMQNLRDNSGGTPSPYLDIHYTTPANAGGEKKMFRAHALKNNSNPTWNDVDLIYFQATLSEILAGSLTWQCKDDVKMAVDPLLCQGDIPLAKYFSTERSRRIEFRESAYNDSNREICQIEGALFWANAPEFAQMIGGVHGETGITGGRFVPVPGIQRPKVFVEILGGVPEGPTGTDSGAPVGASTAAPMIPSRDVSLPRPSAAPSMAYEPPSTYEPTPAAPAAPLVYNPVPAAAPVQPAYPAPAPVANVPYPGAVPAAAPLPAGWEERRDTTGRVYYANVATKSTQWDRPTAPAVMPAPAPAPAYPSAAPAYPSAAPAYPPAPSAAPAYPGAAAPAYPGSALPPYPGDLPAYPGASPAPAYPPVNPAPTASLPASSTGLPPGWEQRTDATGRTYYANALTKSTQWDRPAFPPVAAQPTMTPVAGALPAYPGAAPASQLPAGWEERKDATGRTFYANAVTKTTQWDRPTMPAMAAQPVVTPIPAAPAAVSSGLPAGWEARKDASGRVYYVNHATQTTQWTVPTEPSPAPVRAVTGVPIAGIPVSSGLPAGWEERHDATGRIYYANAYTKSTQWDRPTAPAAPSGGGAAYGQAPTNGQQYVPGTVHNGFPGAGYR